MKRKLSLLLVLAMLVSLVTIPSFAESLDPERDYFSTYGGNSLNIKQGTPTIDGLVDEEYLSSAAVISDRFVTDDEVPVDSPNVIDADFVTYILADTYHLYYVAVVRDHDVVDKDVVNFFMKFGGDFVTVGVYPTTGDVDFGAGTLASDVDAAVSLTSYGYIVEAAVTLTEANKLSTGSTFGYHTFLTDYNSDGERDERLAGNFFDTIYNVTIDHPTEMTTSFAEGSGRPDDPYVVSSLDYFKLMASLISTNSANSFGKSYRDCSFVLTTDIDFGNKTWTPLVFNGTFYGNGHTVSNLKVKSAVTEGNGYYAGFFAQTGDSTAVYNLNINNISINVENAPSAIGDIGGFVGAVGGVIDSCSVTNATIVAYANGQFGVQAGAFAGYGGATITNSYASNVTLTLTGSTGDKGTACGFVGNGENKLNISNCYIANVTMTGVTRGYDAFIEISGANNCFYYNYAVNGGAAQTTSGYASTAAYIYNTLNWSDSVWLAIDGALPTLKPVEFAIVTFAGGNGTAASPYLVENAEQLKLMSKLITTNDASCATASYKLIANIDLGGETWTPIGGANETFNGSFDGNGFSITNFKITSSPHQFYTGFFTVIGSSAEVANLRLANFSVIDTSGAPINWVGAIAGKNDGMIKNCIVQYGTVKAASADERISGNMAGGIAGFCSNTITNCIVDSCTIALGDVGIYALGGLCGSYDMGAAIQYCMLSNTTFESPSFYASIFSILGGRAPSSAQGYEVADNTYYNITYGSEVGVDADGFAITEDYVYDELFMEADYWAVGKMIYLKTFGDIIPLRGETPVESPFTVTVSGSETVNKGDRVGYTFTVSDLNGVDNFYSVEFAARFDSAVLTYVDFEYTAPESWSVYVVEGTGLLNVYMSDDMMMDPSADLTVTLYFTVNADTTAETTVISSESVSGTDGNDQYQDGTGSELTVSIVASEPLAGDVNGNGVLDSNDLALIRSMIIGTTEVVEIADVNGNGKIDSNDYILVRRAILNNN